MKYLIGLIILILSMNNAFASITITGTGATIPLPIYTKWAYEYHKITGIKINYQGMGSSAGIKQIIKKINDFASSDYPLSKKQINLNNLFQFPVITTGIVPVVNLPYIKKNSLILNGKIIADIFLKKITHWDDNNIKKLNPHINLKHQDIILIRRSDSSGTSFAFTKYLYKSNIDWKNKIGFGVDINWPTSVGAKGKNGVSTFVKKIPGSIGYVEFSYAIKNNLSYINLIQNFKIISPKINNFVINDIKNTNNTKWPISTTNYIILNKDLICINKKIIIFFNWIYNNGIEYAHALEYNLIPKNIIKQVEKSWKDNLEYSFNK